MATIHGDTSTSLSCHQVGGDQFIQGDDGVNSYTAVYNYLYGDAYLMRGFARGGNDTILGGSAGILNEQIYGDAYVMRDFTQGGNDLIVGGSGDSHSNPLAFGDAYEMHGFAHGGDDRILGGSGTVYGDAFTMDGFTVGGDDMITAGSLRKSVFGDAATLSGFARGGNDRIIGPAASVSCIIQGDGRMSDNAVGGDDVIVAGAHSSNQIWGDGERTGGNTVGGSDTFVFAPGIAQNRIMDFGQGQDHIDLTAFASIGVHDLGDLSIRSGSISLPSGPSYTGSLITFGTDSYIALVGVEHPAGSDFIFA